MLEALVIVLREGVEAALVLAIVLAYLKKSGRANLAPYVYAGVAAAIAMSIAGAFALSRLRMDVEPFEGPLMLAGAACVVTLVVWMNRAARGLKREIESHVEVASEHRSGAGAGVFIFAAFMVLREGVETVLFLAATSFTSRGLSQLVGAGLGLALAVLFAYFLLRGSLRVDLGKFFRVTTLVLYVLAFQLVVGGFHEMAEQGIVPSTHTLMALIGPIVRYETWIFLAALVLAIGLVGLGARRDAPTAPYAPGAGADPDNAAARRLALAAARRQRVVKLGGAFTGLAVVGILVAGVALTPGPPPKEAAAAERPDATGQVDLPLSTVNDGRVHFFEIPDPAVAGATLRFFVMKKPDGSLQACMDACEICGDMGYYEDAVGLNCRNCGAPINPASLGQTGGCNPIPVHSRVVGDQLHVDASSIYAQRIASKGRH
jgi:FTR1 family protein